ncbi:MAG: translocation/assembly module TamB domain-containing protein, partial [Myxococcota bacterium]
IVDQLELASQRGDAVNVRGVLSSDEVDLSLSTRGDMWFLPAFLPRLQGAGGRLELDLALTGNIEKTSMLGQGRIAGGRFELDFLDDPVEDVSARLLFRGPNVLIESMRGTVGSAPVKGQGSVTLDGVSPAFYDVDLQVRDLPLRLPAWLPTRSSGRLAIRGDAALPTLSGELDVHEAIYREDINWERALPDLRRRSAELQVFDKAKEDLKFDVHLVADGGVRVENNVLDVEAKGDLFLVGTDERPGLRGTLSLLRGNANFRGNRYRLGTGTIDFVETYRIAPVVDLRAETSVKGYDLSARVSGPLSREVQIELTSRPELTEIDILALLTFGFTQQELQEANNASAGAGAGLEMVGADTGLNEEVRRILPKSFREKGFVAVDELRLTSVFSERQGASVPAVALSVELNPGLLWGLADQSRLRLQSTLVDTGGSGPEQRVEWEKRFANDVRFRFVWRKQDTGLGGQASQNGDFGADAWYRWEF